MSKTYKDNKWKQSEDKVKKHKYNQKFEKKPFKKIEDFHGKFDKNDLDELEELDG